MTSVVELKSTYTVSKDVKECSELLAFLATFANAVADSLGDGKVDWLDMGRFFAIIPTLPAAINGIQNIPSEIKDLTPDERNLLTGQLSASLRISPAAANELAADGLNLTLELIQFINKVKAAKKPK